MPGNRERCADFEGRSSHLGVAPRQAAVHYYVFTRHGADDAQFYCIEVTPEGAPTTIGECPHQVRAIGPSGFPIGHRCSLIGIAQVAGVVAVAL